MNTPEQEELLRQLMRDERWPAVEQWIAHTRLAYVEASSAQSFAHHHGALAHAAGSVFALGELLHDLDRIRAESGKRRKSKEPPEA